jgi:hypothetical protein
VTLVYTGFHPTLSQNYDTTTMVLQCGGIAPDEPPVYSGAYPGTGWTVGTVSAGNYSVMRGRSTQTAGTFGTAGFTQAPNGSTRCAFRSVQKFNGSYTAQNWYFSLYVRGETSASTHKGYPVFTLWHGPNASGAGAVQVGTTYSNPAFPATISDTTSVVSSGGNFAVGAFDLKNEYIFVIVYWQVHTAGGSATDSLTIRPELSSFLPEDGFTPTEDSKALYAIEVDWMEQGFFNSGNVIHAFDDVTRDTVTFKTTRGRSDPQPFISTSEVGQLTLRLRNTNGEYSAHTSSLLINNVTAGKEIRVRTVYPYDGYVWSGYILKIESVAEIAAFPYVIVTALGKMQRLVGHKISPAVTSTSTPISTIAQTVLLAADWPAAEISGTTSRVSLDKWFASEEEPFEILKQLFDTEISWFYEGANGFFYFEDRDYRRNTTRCVVSNALFSDASTATYRYKAIKLLTQDGNKFDRVAVPLVIHGVSPNTLIWNANGHLAIIFVGANSTAQFTVEYERSRVLITLEDPIRDERGNIVSGGHQAEVDSSFVVTWTLPTFDNGGIVSSADWYPYISTAEVEATSNRYVFTITNTRTTAFFVPAYIAIRGDVAYVLPQQTVLAGTGVKEYPFPANYYSNRVDAQTGADYLLNEFKYPRDLLEMTIGANRNYDTMRKVLTMELSDRITVTATGAKTKLGIAAKAFYVENIQHEVDMVGNRHTTTLQCSAVDPNLPSGITAFGTRQSDYAIFDTAVFDASMFQ